MYQQLQNSGGQGIFLFLSELLLAAAAADDDVGIDHNKCD